MISFHSVSKQSAKYLLLNVVDTAWYQGLSNINTCRPGLVVPPEPTTSTAMPTSVTTPDLRGPPGPKGDKVQTYLKSNSVS